MPVAPYPVYRGTGPWSVPSTGFAGGVAPSTLGGRGQGFARVGPGWVGRVRVGPGRAPAAPAAPAAPWKAPPFPPTGTFNPVLELEAQEGQRGLEQSEGEAAKTEQGYRNRYATGMSELGRQEGEENTGYSNALKLLADSFTKLGTSQQERANAAGVLQGGALLQAAAKRSANEGKQKATDTEAHNKNIEALNRSRGKLGEELAPPDASNPLGGTLWQALTESMAKASGNTTFFRQSREGLAGQEAAERGFTGYTRPAAPKAAARGAGGRRLWNAGQHRMMNYRNGRWS